MEQEKSLISDNIFKIFKKEKYFILLQGVRGSGKKLFCSEMQKKYPELVVCSFYDYLDDNNEEYKKSMSAECFKYSKDKAKKALNLGKSVIYNNTNTDEAKNEDLIKLARDLKFSVIILRFIPKWDEDMCVNIYSHYHPKLQYNVSKQTIIKDYINLIKYENKNKLSLFGISVSPITKSESLFKYETFSPNLEAKRKEYIEKKYYIEPVKETTKLNFKHNPQIQIPQLVLPPVFQEQLKTQNSQILFLMEQINAMQKQIENIQIGEKTCIGDLPLKRNRTE